jgi:NAD(P)-dependent dehydrogenase (short-subunit alcohol dehydrogenase family)
VKLKGRIALVAGATRGAGRGIAVALGEAGATVYCTGRSTRQRPGGRPETIEDTADLVTQAGGKGIAVRCDHTDEAQVEALASRIAKESGGLDILVNDVWGGDDLIDWSKPFHEIPIQVTRKLLDQAVVSHILTTQRMASLLRDGALVVEVTDGDSMQYRGQFLYDLVKTTVIRLAFAWHEELSPRCAAIAVSPGFLRSEAMLERFGVTKSTWREGIAKDADWAASETPAFVGRAVAALACDPDVPSKSGRVFGSWTLAREYGFTDADGSRPDWGRHFEARYGPVLKVADEGYYGYLWGRKRMFDEIAKVKARDPA